MATFALIHGGGGSAWDWHLVDPELRKLGHDVVAVDLPAEDESAGLEEYAGAVVDAVGDRGDRDGLIVVGHSFGGFTAPLVCERAPVELLVLLAGVVPAPGEPPGDWWANTRHEQFDPDDDAVTAFMHDVPPELAAEALARERGAADTPMGRPWPLEAWPDVPTRYLLCRDDRYFPAPWMRALVRERLGIEPDEIDGSHCVYLSRPRELAERLDAFAGQASQAPAIR